MNSVLNASSPQIRQALEMSDLLDKIPNSSSVGISTDTFDFGVPLTPSPDIMLVLMGQFSDKRQVRSMLCLPNSYNTDSNWI